MRTAVSSQNSAGDQQGIAGVWTSTARKYPELKFEGNRTAVRKESSLCVRVFKQSLSTYRDGVGPHSANQTEVLRKYSVVLARGNVIV